MPCRGRIGELVVISRIRGQKLTVEWRILDVLSLPGGSDDYYHSPVFRIDDERWCLRLWPNWTDETRQSPSSSGWVGLDLERLDEGPSEIFHTSVGIRGSGGVEKSRGGKKKFGYFCFWNEFCSRSELMELSTRLMPHGVLTITCFVKRVNPHAPTGQQPSDDCAICCDKPIDSILYRCGHMCMCYTCAFKLWKSKSYALCPVCRNSIKDVVKVFK